jgi:hypothetical protein
VGYAISNSNWYVPVRHVLVPTTFCVLEYQWLVCTKSTQLLTSGSGDADAEAANPNMSAPAAVVAATVRASLRLGRTGRPEPSADAGAVDELATSGVGSRVPAVGVFRSAERVIVRFMSTSV